jgi:hypothetical protein
MCRQSEVLATLTESRLGLTKAIFEYCGDKEVVVVVCYSLRFADL